MFFKKMFKFSLKETYLYYIFLYLLKISSFLCFSWFFTFIIFFIYKDIIIIIISKQLQNYNDMSYIIFTHFTEIFILKISLIFYLTTTLILPFFLYTSILYFLPILTNNLFFFLLNCIYTFTLLFFISIFLYSYILQLFLKFFLFDNDNYNQNKNAIFNFYLELSLDNYINFFFTYIFTMSFLLFITFIITICYINKIIPKIYIFGIILFNVAIISPPEIFFQLFFILFAQTFAEILICIIYIIKAYTRYRT